MSTRTRRCRCSSTPPAAPSPPGAAGEAQEALERAESRALSRSVRPSRAGQPSRQPVVERISAARAGAGTGDRLRVLQLIDEALAAEAAEPQ